MNDTFISNYFVAICRKCGWEMHFRKIVGVDAGLQAKHLLEEVKAIHEHPEDPDKPYLMITLE